VLAGSSLAFVAFGGGAARCKKAVGIRRPPVGLLVDGVLFDQWYDSKSTGLENAPEALRRLFEGRNEGEQLLRVAE
jgi:hypothetical protein